MGPHAINDLLKAVSEGLRDDLKPISNKAGQRPESDRDRDWDGAGFEKAIKKWRTEEAKRRGLSIQAILPSRCLRALASGKLRDERSLRELPGLGDARVDRYGEAILRMVQQYVTERP